MKIRLAGGVVAAGRDAWLPGGRTGTNPRRVRTESEASPGAAVALGPPDAVQEQVHLATTELKRLLAAGGVVAAGAGVDLGHGFHSARLAGARGDQRDAVLAALRALGAGQAHRLGDRTRLMTALFGPAVTRRVGAATARAVAEGRWSALHLAVAASDLLGPEQLERVLDLAEPPGADLIPGGLPSDLARDLAQVLDPMARPRRLNLIVDLWDRVCEHHADLLRRRRRIASQSRRDRVADLRRRRAHHEDALILERLQRASDCAEPSLADAARWIPPAYHWSAWLARLHADAIAATALLRTAVAVADHGVAAGLERSEPLIRAAAALLPDHDAARSARAVPGLTGLPARPGAYVRDLRRRLDADQAGRRRADQAEEQAGGRSKEDRLAGYVKPRLAAARDFAAVIIEDFVRVLNDADDATETLEGALKALQSWGNSGLGNWRATAGYSAVRPPTEWQGIPYWSGRLRGSHEPLAERITGSAEPMAAAAGAETMGDLLWFAELIDALAQVYGHDAARPTPGTGSPWFDHDPPPPPDEPLTPRLDSIPVAVAGVAQLVSVGGEPPAGARTWAAVTDGLLSGTAIREALTGEFNVPAELAALDGTVLPGASVRIEVARNARMLAEWSARMGNCIAGPGYVSWARTGRCVLIGLYDRDGALLANADLHRLRPATRGWAIDEIAGRFNEAPDQALARRFGEWVATIPGGTEDFDGADGADDMGDRAVGALGAVAPRVRSTGRRRSGRRLAEEVGPVLGPLVERAWDELDPDALATYAALAGVDADAEADAATATAQVRLRRLRATGLAAAVRRSLDAGVIDLADLWDATAARPLTAALDAMDPVLRNRFEALSAPPGEPPLPRAVHELVKSPQIADAYGLELVARRIRAALGTLACQDDPAFAHAVVRGPSEAVLCALVITTTCDPSSGIDLVPVAAPRVITVPGYPVTSLDDENGPWQRSLPAARELGADTEVLWERIAEHGLRAPRSWLARGGWTALWARAHEPRPRAS